MASLRSLIRSFVGRVRFGFASRKAAFATVGNGFYCASRLWISRGVRVSIGRWTYIGRSCHIGTDVTIGDSVLIASNVAFVGGDHEFSSLSEPIRLQGRGKRRGVRIADDVWIGHGSIILDGINIGSGAVIGAGSVVTRDIPSHAISVGNPARTVRFRV